MATRKKSPQTRPGLFHGPSRKQFDTFTPRSGEYVRPEKQNSLTVTKFYAAGTNQNVFFSTTANQQARILYISVNYTAGAGSASLLFSEALSSFGTTFLMTFLNTGIVNQSFNYDSAPIIPPNNNLMYNQFLGGNAYVTVTYIIESSSSGYFSN